MVNSFGLILHCTCMEKGESNKTGKWKQQQQQQNLQSAIPRRSRVVTCEY